MSFEARAARRRAKRARRHRAEQVEDEIMGAIWFAVLLAAVYAITFFAAALCY